tara:strand:- start:2320 stop:2781 length:462 start_codon:yes stop_codon:yes gene_type:complete
LSYNWNVYKIFNNGKRAKAPMHTFTYADEDKVQEYFDTVIKENFEEKIRRWDFTLLRADQPQERKAEVVDEEAKLLERNQNRVFGRLLQSAHLPPNTKAVVAGLVCCEKSDWEWQWAVVQEGTSMYLAGLSPTFKSHIQANEWMNEKINELAH